VPAANGLPSAFTPLAKWTEPSAISPAGAAGEGAVGGCVFGTVCPSLPLATAAFALGAGLFAGVCAAIATALAAISAPTITTCFIVALQEEVEAWADYTAGHGCLAQLE
jgi:hypothetical protein